MGDSIPTKAEESRNHVAFRERRPYGTLKPTNAICHIDETGLKKMMPVVKLQMFQN